MVHWTSQRTDEEHSVIGRLFTKGMKGNKETRMNEVKRNWKKRSGDDGFPYMKGLFQTVRLGRESDKGPYDSWDM